jgi:hypothetical protein
LTRTPAPPNSVVLERGLSREFRLGVVGEFAQTAALAYVHSFTRPST